MAEDFDPISLSRPVPESPAVAADTASGQRISVNSPRVLEIPENGCITFRFKRGTVTLQSSSAGNPGSARADLELLEIVDVEAGECDEPETKESAPDKIDELFRQLTTEPDGDE